MCQMALDDDVIEITICEEFEGLHRFPFISRREPWQVEKEGGILQTCPGFKLGTARPQSPTFGVKLLNETAGPDDS